MITCKPQSRGERILIFVGMLAVMPLMLGSMIFILMVSAAMALWKYGTAILIERRAP